MRQRRMWGPPPLHRALASIPAAGAHWASALRLGLRWCAAHTGVPVVLIAAVALVASWRLARRSARLTVEVALALGVLLFATRLGWLRW